MTLPNERASDELTDTSALASVFQRQLDCSLMARQIAQQLYAARTAWIGGGMDWKDLSPLQQKTYRDEVCLLITGPQTAPESLPQQADGYRDTDLDGKTEQENA